MTDYKSVLLASERQLQHKLDKLHADFGITANANSSERALERENDEVLDQLERQTAQELQQVRNALQAIAVGSYGICIDCGEKIQTERLDLLPYSLQCQHCA